LLELGAFGDWTARNYLHPLFDTRLSNASVAKLLFRRMPMGYPSNQYSSARKLPEPGRLADRARIDAVVKPNLRSRSVIALRVDL
jgi:hypothetical protein